MSPVKYVVACPYPDNTVWKLALVPADKASQACLMQLRAFSESLCLARLRLFWLWKAQRADAQGSLEVIQALK